MPFAWQYGAYNARASFNRWFKVNLTASGWPSAGSFAVNFEYPDLPLSFPSISVTHLGGGGEAVGSHVGGAAQLSGLRQHQLTDLSMWVSGQANAPWVRDLWQLRDMAVRLIQASTGFPLLDVYAATANPSTVGLVRFGPGDPVEDASAPLEPSPNIHRQRLLVRWYWLAQT